MADTASRSEWATDRRGGGVPVLEITGVVEAYTDRDPITRVLKFTEVFDRLRRK